MKDLFKAVQELNLTANERNNFKQCMKDTSYFKHFNKLSLVNLKILEKLFIKQKHRYEALFRYWGTQLLFDYVKHCEYALNKINIAMELKNA